MANHIAAHFRHRPPAEAAEEVAEHIRLFWEERMRARLLAELAAGVGVDEGVDPIVIDAAELLRVDAAGPTP
jgi:formate dehydrogenase subunit delta